MPKPSNASRLPAAPSGHEDRAKIHERLALVRAIVEQHAATIIAAGLFSDDEQWTELASALATREVERTAAAVADFLGDEYVPNPERPRETIATCDLVAQLTTAYLDAGFLVGLAVGMQLGPSAFSKGGVK